MIKGAPISPKKKRDNIEELHLPPEIEVAIFDQNANTRLFNESPVNHDFDEVVNFDNNENFELPKPPKVVNVAKPSDDQPAYLWFEYKTNIPQSPVLSWEVKRYKLNKDGRWSFKSSRVFNEKSSDFKKKSRTVSSISTCRWYAQ